MNGSHLDIRWLGTEGLPGPPESLTPDALVWLGPGAMGYCKASQNERKEGREPTAAYYIHARCFPIY